MRAPLKLPLEWNVSVRHSDGRSLVRCPQIEEHCPETIIGTIPKKGPPGVGEKLRARAATAERCLFSKARRGVQGELPTGSQRSAFAG